VPDEWTILLAPEPVLRKMLAAGSGARSPLLDRPRKTAATDEVTGLVVLEPYRPLPKAPAGPSRRSCRRNWPRRPAFPTGRSQRGRR